MSKSDTRLVWSDDPKDKAKVDDGKKKKPEQASSEYVKSTNWVAVFRIEKNGRGGKTVTVIDQLPKHEMFLSELCKELKSKCGSGGTYSMEGKEGLIEIQGDKRAPIKAIFDKKGYKYKGM
ncbi:MAG: translation initiation factor [Bdellovibrionales bacterium]|nr:translation initiation factor [Bdellovibrionales bacterium]